MIPTTTPFVVARDPERGVTLLGGLGVLGVGQMWFADREEYRDYPGFEDALIINTAGKRLFGIDVPGLSDL